MGTQRTSQKDVLNAIEQLTAAVSQLIQTQHAPAMPVIAPEPVAQVAPAKTDTVRISKSYLAAMQPKWQTLANNKGVSYIGFAYRKSNGKTGLWACPEPEYAKVSKRDNHLGAVVKVDPS